MTNFVAMEEAHIYVYGVIDYWQDNNAGEWGYVNLKDVKNQYEAQKEAKKIVVHIHSEGGVVTEGFAIHDYLRSLGKPVEVIIEGMCASIATVIALAGDTRKMAENATFFIHNPWGMIGGDAEQVKKYADELEKMESDIADFYAKKTNLSKDDLLGYMKEESFFTAEQALNFGFITEVLQTMRAVALFRKKPEQKKKSKKNKTMAKNAKKSKFEKLMAKMAKHLNIDEKPKALVLQDVNGTELNFPEVADGETPAIGDTATVDGSPAEGEYTMPEGETYVFGDGGALDTISEAEEEEDSEQVAQLESEVEEKEAEIKALKKKLKNQDKKIDKLQGSFNELKKLAGDIDFEDEGNPNDKKKNSTGVGKTRALWKDGEYKRAN